MLPHGAHGVIYFGPGTAETLTARYFLVIVRSLPSALFNLPDHGIPFPPSAVQHGDRQTFELKGSDGTFFCAVPPGHLKLGTTTTHQLLTHRRLLLTRSFLSLKPLPTSRAVTAADLQALSRAASLISKSDVPHTPCTAGSNPGRPDRPVGIIPPSGGYDDERPQAHGGQV